MYSQENKTNNQFLLDEDVISNISASTLKAFSGNIQVSSEIPFYIFNIFSTLDDNSIQYNELKSLMLLSEQVLARDWNTPEEDEAWVDL